MSIEDKGNLRTGTGSRDRTVESDLCETCFAPGGAFWMSAISTRSCPFGRSARVCSGVICFAPRVQFNRNGVSYVVWTLGFEGWGRGVEATIHLLCCCVQCYYYQPR